MKALVRSQGGLRAGALSHLRHFAWETTIPSHLFRVLLFRRLRQELLLECRAGVRFLWPPPLCEGECICLRFGCAGCQPVQCTVALDLNEEFPVCEKEWSQDRGGLGHFGSSHFQFLVVCVVVAMLNGQRWFSSALKGFVDPWKREGTESVGG